MLPPGLPLLDAVARLGALLGAAEAGEPVEAQVQAELLQMVRACAMPLGPDLSGVQAVLEGMLEDPSPRHLPALLEAVEAVAPLGPPGPTGSLRANVVLARARAAVRTRETEPFSLECQELDAEIAALAERAAALASARAAGRLGEEAEEVARELEAAREALAALYEAVGAGQEEEAARAGQALADLLNRVERRALEMEVLDQHEGQTPCVRCGRYNRGERSTCEECGAILPASVHAQESLLDLCEGEEAGPLEPRMTENLARLFQACEDFQSGLVDAGAFLGEVAFMEDRLARARRMGLGPGPSVRAGAEEIEAGLAALRQAGEGEDRGLLDAGRRLVWEGAGKLQAARP